MLHLPAAGLGGCCEGYSKDQVAGEEQGCQEPQELSLVSEELKVENP